MYLAIFSNEYSVGLSGDDEVFIIKNANDDSEAMDIAEQYAEENNISYASVDIVCLDNCEVINN